MLSSVAVAAALALAPAALPDALPSDLSCSFAAPASIEAAAGARRILVVRVDYPDATGHPVSETGAAEAFGKVSDFYAKMSTRRVALATTVAPVLRMPRSKGTYDVSGGWLLLRTDARNAAMAAGFNPEEYDFMTIASVRVFSTLASGFADAASRTAWLNGVFGASLIAHEMGHLFGLPHANQWETIDGTIDSGGSSVEYGNGFDIMGSGALIHNAHFTTAFKARLGWIDAWDVQDVRTDGVYRIHAHDHADATGLRALRIRKDIERSYWIEHRSAQAGNRWTANGVLIHWGYERQTRTDLIDPRTFGPTAGDTDAALVVGETFSDREAGIHITPIAVGGTGESSWIDVRVQFGAAEGNRRPVLTAEATATRIPPGTPVSFTSAAIDPDGDPLSYVWIFTGPTRFEIDFESGPNATRIWSEQGQWLATGFAFDGRGGVARRSILISVGDPSAPFVNGRVLADGGTTPVPRALLKVLGGRPEEPPRAVASAITDDEGLYVIPGAWTGPLTIARTGFTFSPPQVTLPAEPSAFTADFAATAKPNTPPTARILAPVSGTVLHQPRTLEVTLEAKDEDGSIRRVEVLLNGVVSALGLSVPQDGRAGGTLRMRFDAPGRGDYVLEVVAIDDAGAATISDPVALTITADARRRPVRHP
jgi:hypothetical protein